MNGHYIAFIQDTSQQTLYIRKPVEQFKFEIYIQNYCFLKSHSIVTEIFYTSIKKYKITQNHLCKITKPSVNKYLKSNMQCT